jgi:phosphoribosylanthranilate isomerase
VSKIKICGLSRAEDIMAVNRALPDYIGFVFAESRRKVDADTAAMLKEKLDKRIKAVGVFVNEAIESAGDLFRRGIIDLIQLHGDEDNEYIRRLKEKYGCPVIKAVGIRDKLPVLPAEADYALFDKLSAERGGTGETFDWAILKGIGTPYFLAGGLSADNIAAAVRLLRPFCIDVSSGAETRGVKDAGKISEIVRLVRGLRSPPR